MGSFVAQLHLILAGEEEGREGRRKGREGKERGRTKREGKWDRCILGTGEPRCGGEVVEGWGGAFCCIVL